MVSYVLPSAKYSSRLIVLSKNIQKVFTGEHNSDWDISPGASYLNILRKTAYFTHNTMSLVTETNFSSVADVAILCMPYTFLVMAGFLILKLFVLRDERRPKHKRLPEPPGPIGLPIIGNALQLGPNLPLVFMKLAKRFGDVFKIKLGSRPVIILNGHHAIQQALVRQSIDFAGRPDLTGYRKIIDLSGGLLSFSNYSKEWKLHRKLTHAAIRHFTSGHRTAQFESQVQYEAKEFISFILGENNIVVTNVSNLLRFSVSNVIVNALFNVRHDPRDHASLTTLVEGWGLVIDEISGSNIIDFMPWLRPFLKHRVKAFEAIAERFVSLVQVNVKKHRESYEKGMDSDICFYLKTLFDNMDIQQREKITEKKIMSAVYDVFGAGLEDVPAVIEWIILYAIYYPELQVEMQAEIDEVVGRERLPTLADRGKLPLTEAFLVEVMRHSSVIPTTLPHATTRDTVLEGGFNYFIPKDTLVFVNLFGIHHDPQLWKNSDVFDPRRFFTEDGSKLDTAKVDSLMRFGGGRRRCPGSEVAQIVMFLFFTIMLHQCDLRNVEGQNLSLEGKPMMVLIRSPQYQIEITRRS